MRKPLVVGVLRESIEKGERRTPLTPSDVLWLKELGVDTEVQSSPIRIFKDSQYIKSKAKIVDKFKKASILVGIKQPKIGNLYNNKVYMFFSHTIKGQPENMNLLKECINKKISLIDYEKIIDIHGKRLVYFGRFAGICGVVDSLYYLGRKLEYQGVKNPFSAIRPAHSYSSLSALKKDMTSLGDVIRRKGLNKKIVPFVIGLTGCGHVSLGVQEILELLHPVEIHPKDMRKFVRSGKYSKNKIYKVVFYREEKIRSKKGDGFYFEDYLKYPNRFESNIDKHLPFLNILIHSSYWDVRYPRLITKSMINKLSRKDFRLQFIGDISCDINGSVELTHKSTTIENPVFTYIPKNGSFIDGYMAEGITVLARDNLPTELPRDSSSSFSSMIREHVYQIAVCGAKNLTSYTKLPREIHPAIITQGGKLTASFAYLKKHLNS